MLVSYSGSNRLERANRLERSSFIAILRCLKQIFSNFLFFYYVNYVINNVLQKKYFDFFFSKYYIYAIKNQFREIQPIFLPLCLISANQFQPNLMAHWTFFTWDIIFRRGSREEFFIYLSFKKVYINFQSINQKQKNFYFSLNRKHSQTIFRIFSL